MNDTTVAVTSPPTRTVRSSPMLPVQPANTAPRSSVMRAGKPPFPPAEAPVQSRVRRAAGRAASESDRVMQTVTEALRLFRAVLGGNPDGPAQMSGLDKYYKRRHIMSSHIPTVCIINFSVTSACVGAPRLGRAENERTPGLAGRGPEQLRELFTDLVDLGQGDAADVCLAGVLADVVLMVGLGGIETLKGFEGGDDGA